MYYARVRAVEEVNYMWEPTFYGVIQSNMHACNDYKRYERSHVYVRLF